MFIFLRLLVLLFLLLTIIIGFCLRSNQEGKSCCDWSVNARFVFTAAQMFYLFVFSLVEVVSLVEMDHNEALPKGELHLHCLVLI